MAAMCKTSRFLFHRLKEQVYEIIDVSQHVNGVPIGNIASDKFLDSRADHPVYARNDTRNDRDNILWDRQCLLLKRLREHPEHCKRVRSIRWTLTFFQTFPEQRHQSPKWKRVVIPGGNQFPNTTWDVLKLFGNVRTVELSEFDSAGYFRRNIPYDLVLFPKTTSLALVSRLTNNWVDTVLTGNTAAQLQYLRLDKLTIELQRHDYTVGTILAIKCLIGRLNCLKSLEINQKHSTLVADRNHRHSYGTEADAYASLLRSVSSTIETFRFKILSSRSFPGASHVLSIYHHVIHNGDLPHLTETAITHDDSDDSQFGHTDTITKFLEAQGMTMTML